MWSEIVVNFFTIVHDYKSFLIVFHLRFVRSFFFGLLLVFPMLNTCLTRHPVHVISHSTVACQRARTSFLLFESAVFKSRLSKKASTFALESDQLTNSSKKLNLIRRRLNKITTTWPTHYPDNYLKACKIKFIIQFNSFKFA